MAPTVVVSGMVSTINFLWNVYNVRRGDKVRRIDHEKAVFNAQVATPVESSLTKFEEFVISLGKLDRQHARLSVDPQDEKARTESYGKLQTETFEPAMAQFQSTLRRVAAMRPTPGGIDWPAMEDALDPVLTSFDTLCRFGCEPERLRAASTAVRQAVESLCADLRARMNHIQRSLVTL